ncbi:MAG: chromosomal replication initiator DnaA [Hyphomicrobium sp.]|jgi:chromosomal replication initiation ATPase DnaA|nr:chromosomal replication initiator DnaA [Hyphomicrobium sp.]
MDVPIFHSPATRVCAAYPAESYAASGRLRTIVETSVGLVFGISREQLGSVTRGRARAALARQVAMYLCHVGLRLSLTDVGRTFGRDRTTVSHACGVVEDLRDDPRFDRVLDMLERIVRFQAEPMPAAPAARAEDVQ